MANTQPTLALVQPAESLRRTVESAFSQVWVGRRVITSIAGASSLKPELAVVASARAPEAWRVALEISRKSPHTPILAVVEGAEQLRNEGGVPRQVVWAASPSELDQAQLTMSVRYALLAHQHREAQETVRELRSRDQSWLMSHVSHEIGNPLTTLLTNLEFLQGQLSPGAAVPSEAHDVLYDARVAAAHIARIAEDLRRASRRTPRHTSVDLQEVLDTARRLAGEPLRGVDVQVRAGSCPPVRADETRLCQVFLNLLRNAGRALQDTPDPRVTVRVGASETQVAVRISNNGPPIPDEVVPNLFQKGFTTHEDGRGIGLPLSREFMREMGGTLRLLQHSPEVVFEVRLLAVPRSDAPETLVPLRKGRGGRVLVVEDEPSVRKAIRRVLATQFEVDQAESVEEAVRYAAMARYDLLFVDLHLHGESGLDVHRALMRQPGAMPRLVYVSGWFSDEEMAYIERHKLPYAFKPLPVASLRELVAELVAANRISTPGRSPRNA